jgi:hypothetical protein
MPAPKPGEIGNTGRFATNNRARSNPSHVAVVLTADRCRRRPAA